MAEKHSPPGHCSGGSNSGHNVHFNRCRPHIHLCTSHHSRIIKSLNHTAWVIEPELCHNTHGNKNTDMRGTLGFAQVHVPYR